MGVLALVDRLLAYLLGFVVAPVLRLSGRRVGLALVYHQVAETNRPVEARLVPTVSPSDFSAQLQHLRRHFEVVPPSRLLEAVRKRRRGQRFPVALTFDDDLRSHVATALPLLRQVDVPAVFFLSGASFTGPYRFWWERLEASSERGLDLTSEIVLGSRGGEPEPTLPELARNVEQMAPWEREAVASRLGEALGADPEDAGLRASDVRELADAGVEIGFHTLRHDALPALDDASLAHALVDGRRALADAAGREPTMLAYPHGRADARVAAAARAAGYELAFTGAGQAVTAGSEPLLLGRLDVSTRRPSQLVLVLVRALLHAHDSSAVER
jgi:peptidoglycan/xylan/chitin deacetylase (PgdA/CDA1 family)